MKFRENLTEKLIEKEVQKRVGFKVQAIRTQFKMGLDASKLADKHSWGHIQTRGFLKAFEIAHDMMEKELTMGTPHDGDFEIKIWKRKEKLVDKLTDRLLNRGTRDYDHKKSFINDSVENFIDN